MKENELGLQGRNSAKLSRLFPWNRNVSHEIETSYSDKAQLPM